MKKTKNDKKKLLKRNNHKLFDFICCGFGCKEKNSCIYFTDLYDFKNVTLKNLPMFYAGIPINCPENYKCPYFEEKKK